MASIRLAANHVDWTPGNPGHLHIVYISTDGTQSEIEVQAPLTLTAGYWVFPEMDDHTADSYFESPGNYMSVELDLGGRSASEIWTTLTLAYEEFRTDAPQINYDIYKNSNSYVTTLLRDST